VILNILHRPGLGEIYEFFQMQQDWAHELGLKVTAMATYPTLQDERIVSDLKQYAEEYGDELGIYFSELYCPEFDKKIGSDMDAVWLYSEEDKRRIFELVLEQFRDRFGRDPVSIAGYHLDAVSLKILLELCPSIQVAVAGCFEEGVRVFHGCNHSWYLFNEGMPWNPWYPSKDNALRPASNEAEALGIVAVPHLSRDMALSYEGRNDFWASHPGNAMRGMGYENGKCPYNLNLVDQYRAQEKYNQGFSYYNVFVGPGWLTHNMNIDDPPEVSQRLHREQYEYFVDLRSDGKLTDMTMSEFARWYRANRPIGTPEVYWAKEMLYGSGKHYFWYIDPEVRVLVDPTQGGSIGDLRPYAARLPGFTGPDSPTLAIGSYPYLIQSQHRTGLPNHFADGARTTLEVRCGEDTVDLCTCPTVVDSVDQSEDGYSVRLRAAEISFSSGITAEIVTTYSFPGDGRILMRRELQSVSDPSVELQLREYIKGCWGYTEYPEDMHGIVLSVRGEKTESLSYEYRSRALSLKSANSATVRLPRINSELTFESLDGPVELGEAIEGHLFSPYYTLSLTRSMKNGGSWNTCLSVNKAM